MLVDSGIAEVRPATAWLRVRALGQGALVRSGVWGLIDQGILSATNFITLVLLARSVSPAAFGLFTIVYAGFLIAGSVQGALITQPHNVLAATLTGEGYVRYTSSAAALQAVMTGSLALVALALALAFRGAAPETAALLLAVAPAIAGWQLQEFVRRVLYTEGRVSAAVANDAISYGGQVTVVALLWALGLLTGPLTFYVVAATSLAATAVGLWQLRQSITRAFHAAVLRENWTFGRWLLGSEIAFWLSQGLYFFLVAAILGAADVGAFKACQVFVGPLYIMLTSLDSILPIRFARTYAAGGPRALHTQLTLTFILTAPLVLGYCFLLTLFAEPLLRLTYGDSYAGFTRLLALFAVSAFAVYIMRVLGSALKAKRIPRYIFFGYIGAAVFAVSLGWLLVDRIGVEGAALGWIVTYSTVAAISWWGYRRGAPERPAASASDPAAVEYSLKEPAR